MASEYVGFVILNILINYLELVKREYPILNEWIIPNI